MGAVIFELSTPMLTCVNPPPTTPNHPNPPPHLHTPPPFPITPILPACLAASPCPPARFGILYGGHGQVLLCQVIEALSICAWVGVMMGAFFGLLKVAKRLRVPVDQELAGLGERLGGVGRGRGRGGEGGGGEGRGEGRGGEGEGEGRGWRGEGRGRGGGCCK